ncbi:MAG: FkbM family methyltransferase, partial [Verrucomicrobiales bacterium]|nr:FkbM family methyltransferase [Verrucomicrobiales bacterium]
MRFVVMPGMGATYALGQDHWHFPVFQQHLRPGMTVFDVGANCGQTALFFSRQTGPQGKVHAFEPVPQNAAVLRRNMELNHGTNVEVVEAAVAADTQSRAFCFDAGHHTMGTLEGAMVKLEAWQTTLEVTCVTLDDYVDEGARRPDLIKIDVEGSGLGVIEGAARLLETHRPMIYFELH